MGDSHGRRRDARPATASGQRWIYPTDGSGAAPQSIKGIDRAEDILRFAADGRSLLVRARIDDGATQVFRVNAATGARVLVRTITPLTEAISAGGVGELLITADGSSYVYEYGVLQSELFLVKGLK